MSINGKFTTVLAASVVVASLSACGQQPVDSQQAAKTNQNNTGYTPRPAPQPVRVTVPAGTEVHVTLSSNVGSETSQVGDNISATTTSAVLVGNRIAIPAGSTIQGQVTGVGPASKGLNVSEKGGSVVLSFDKVTTPRGDSSNMSGSLTSIASSKGKTAGIIGGSAAGGALLGKILGGSTKDAVVGAVVGGGIGTGIAAGTKGKKLEIPAGTALAFTLDQSLNIADRT